MQFQETVVRGVFVGITDQGMVPMVLLELKDNRFVRFMWDSGKRFQLRVL